MKILVCGGRGYNRRDVIFATLDNIHSETPISYLIEGGARGVDQLAYAWARERGLDGKTYPADWAQHGKAAGPIRNRQMLESGNPDLVIAFPGGRGTAHMIGLAKAANVPVKEIVAP